MPLGPTLTHHQERQLAVDVHRLVAHYPFVDLLVYLRAATEARYGSTSCEYRALDDAYATYDRVIDVPF